MLLNRKQHPTGRSIVRRKQDLLLAMTISAIALAACGDSRREEVAAGEVVSDSIYRPLDYPLTSENYRRWLAAQRSLDTLNIDAPVRVDVRRVTPDDIDRVVRSLESQPPARTAIEGSGLGVRDFVLTTIALAQSWDAVDRGMPGFSEENLAFVQRVNAEDPDARTRSRARFLSDDDSDSDSERRKPKKNKRGRGSDSDS
jgi:hypothetical protein